MTNYHVTVRLDDPADTLFMELEFKVKHFRLNEGRKYSPKGGYTCLFDVHRGLVFTAKCSEKEQFSRKKGILTCLQKMLYNPARLGISDPGTGTKILSVVFEDNHATVWIGKGTQKVDFWLENGVSL